MVIVIENYAQMISLSRNSILALNTPFLTDLVTERIDAAMKVAVCHYVKLIFESTIIKA